MGPEPRKEAGTESSGGFDWLFQKSVSGAYVRVVHPWAQIERRFRRGILVAWAQSGGGQLAGISYFSIYRSSAY